MVELACSAPSRRPGAEEEATGGLASTIWDQRWPRLNYVYDLLEPDTGATFSRAPPRIVPSLIRGGLVVRYDGIPDTWTWRPGDLSPGRAPYRPVVSVALPGHWPTDVLPEEYRTRSSFGRRVARQTFFFASTDDLLSVAAGSASPGFEWFIRSSSSIRGTSDGIAAAKLVTLSVDGRGRVSGNVSDPSVLVPGALPVVPARPEGAVRIDDLYAAGKPLNKAAGSWRAESGPLAEKPSEQLQWPNEVSAPTVRGTGRLRAASISPANRSARV